MWGEQQQQQQKQKKKNTRTNTKEVSNIMCNDCNNTDSLIYLLLICSGAVLLQMHFVDVISTVVRFYFCSVSFFFFFIHFVTIFHVFTFYYNFNDGVSERFLSHARHSPHSFVVVQNAYSPKIPSCIFISFVMVAFE